MSGTTSAIGEPLGIPPHERPRNLLDLIRRGVRRWPEHEAVRWRTASQPSSLRGDWSSWTYAQLWDEIGRTSAGLAASGVQRGDRVAILSRSRPEWLVADLAALALGAVTCPIQPSEPPGRIAAQIGHLKPRLVVVENDHLLHRLLRGTGDDALGTPIVGIEPVNGQHRTLADIAASGDRSAEAARAWEERALAIEPASLATIVHTMGEDGSLRGAMLTHGNVVHSALAATRAIPISDADVILSVLPLSHMFERGGNVLACLGVGATVVFADRAMERWLPDLAEVRATVLCCVPLFYEQLEQRIREQVARRPAYARALFGWAQRVGRRRDDLRSAGKRLPISLRLAHALAQLIVAAPVQRALGGRLRFFVSGGAPLPAATGRFFESLGLPILEGYGLTETAPLVTVNRLGSHRYGSVGQAAAETELRIAADTGEILVRGPQVMVGYLDLPDVTARTIDADGWFHTGDCGALDEAAHLSITGRIKDLIVLATGKKVAPAPIERLLAGSPLIAQAVLLGDGRDAVSVLIAPSADALTGSSRDLVERLHHEVERLTSELAAYERPRRVALLPRLLAVKTGELRADGTPDRAAVRDHFPEAMAALLGSA